MIQRRAAAERSPADIEDVAARSPAPAPAEHPLSPRSILDLQRTAGNTAVVAMVARARSVQRQIADTVQLVHQRAAQYFGNPPFDPNALGQVLTAFDAFMRQQGVAYRFGGSMAAWIQGGGRVPQDIDIEVANPNRMQALARVLATGASGWTGNGRTDHTGRVILLNAVHQSQPTLTFDMVSEADPALMGPAAVHEGMEVDQGELGETGGLTSPPELIINYLDRILNKPHVAQAKNDVAQIGNLLTTAAGGWPNLRWQYWDNQIVPAMSGQAAVDRLRPAFEQVVGPRPQVAVAAATTDMDTSY